MTWEISKAVKLGADYENFKRVQDLIEATLFLSDVPVKEKRLAEGLGLDQQIVSEALKVLTKEYESRGILLKNGPSGWECVSDPRLGPELAALVRGWHEGLARVAVEEEEREEVKQCRCTPRWF